MLASSCGVNNINVNSEIFTIYVNFDLNNKETEKESTCLPTKYETIWNETLKIIIAIIMLSSSVCCNYKYAKVIAGCTELTL